MASYPSAAQFKTHRQVRNLKSGAIISRHVIDCRELVACRPPEWEWVTPPPSENAVPSESPETFVDPTSFARIVISSGKDDALGAIDALNLKDPNALAAVAKALELETAGKSRAQVVETLRAAQVEIEDAARGLPKPPKA